MNNTQHTSRVWASEYEIEAGDVISPADFQHRAVLNDNEWFGFDTESNEIYWVNKQEKRMVHMSRDFAREHYPNLFKLYKKMKYD